MSLESRVANWVETRIGIEHMDPAERAMRLFEETVELIQAHGITIEAALRQILHTYGRPAGSPGDEAPGVAIGILGWCAATNNSFEEMALRELRKIEAKPVEQIRASLQRKIDAGLVTTPEAK